MRIVLIFLMLMVVSGAGVGILATTSQGSGFTAVSGDAQTAPAAGRATEVTAAAAAATSAPPVATLPAGESITFTVQRGETTGAIADRLARLGLVQSATLFRFWVQWKGAEGRLQAGDYQLRQGMGMDELVETLQMAKAKDVPLTFVEGQRLEEYADALEVANVGIDANRFRELARRGNFTYDFLESKPPGASLDGYLFPDTYRVVPGKTTPEELIHQMLKRFGDTMPPQLREQAKANTNRTVHELVILASIVEREAQVKEERPRIAAVYHNRLRVNECLCADPTIQYAIGKKGDWWPLLRQRARDIVPDSPYNSYNHLGLPPSPISNPGAAVLRATANPEKTDLMYFVRDDVKNDGSHRFARTLAEHDANRRLYQRGS